MVRDLNEKKALKKLNLNCADVCNLDVSWEDRSVLSEADEFKSCVAKASICAYLPPSKDPTFQYAQAGYVLFESVDVGDPVSGGKGVRKRIDGLFVSLRSTVNASLKCEQAVLKAQSAQQMYYDSCASIIGCDQLAIPLEEDDKQEHAIIQLHAGVLRGLSVYQHFVAAAVTAAQAYVEEYYALWQAEKMSSSTVCVCVASKSALLTLSTCENCMTNPSIFHLMVGCVCW